MRTNIINYINKIQGYKTAIKNLHWCSKHMSEHKLLDDIAETVSNNQDEIAEICQGLYGKIKLNELKPKRYNITNSKKMLNDILRDTKSFYSSLKGRDLSGVRSVVETFIGELDKFIYLMDMCIKEDIKRNLQGKTLNENKKVSLNENELRKLINEAINNVLGDKITSFEKYSELVKEKIENYKNNVLFQLEENKNETLRTLQILFDIINDIKSLYNCGPITVEENDDEAIVSIELILDGGIDDEQYFQLEHDLYSQIKKYDKFNKVIAEFNDKYTSDGTKYIVELHTDILPYDLFNND